MSQLSKLLQFLDRADVTEVVVQTDKPVSAKVGDEYRPLSRSPVSGPQIDALIKGSPIEAVLPKGDASSSPKRLMILGKAYAVRTARRGDVVQIRIGRAFAEVPDSHLRPTAVARIPPVPSSEHSPGSRRRKPRAGEEAPEPERAPASKRASTSERVPASRHAPASKRALAPKSAPASKRGPTSRRTPAAERPALQSGTATALSAARGAPAALKRLEEILAEARGRRASDVHVIADRPVQVRCFGELAPSGDPLPANVVSEMLLALLSPAHRRALEERGYADLSVELSNAGRLRVNVSHQRTGLKGSFRLVRSPLPTLESLGLPQELARVTTYHQGLVVISGPSGHGKTATLAALVDLINTTKARHIITIEDPVEFLHPRKRAVISQREVGTHTRSFATALAASLREDPDVIVIGELRDREAVEIAITAAETGHLVLTTMSTPSGAKTIDRLIDVFPPADQQQVRSTLAGALKFIVAQRLLPTKAGDDRVAAVELITGTPPLWALIRDNKLFHLPNLQQRGRAFGMVRFDDSLAELVRQGKISEETALRHAENRRELSNALRAAAPAPTVPPAPSAPPPAPPPAPALGAQKLTDLAARVGKGIFGKREGS